MRISIYKAGPRRDIEPIPNVTIEIELEFPRSVDNWRENAALFQKDAQEIARVLLASLPGGTIDRLLVELLKAKSSDLVVPL